jgi:hypothetical protein
MKPIFSTLLVILVVFAQSGERVSSQFETALYRAEKALAEKELEVARFQIDRALERDAKSPRAWELRASWAEAVGDRDELVYSLHTRYRLLVAQKADRTTTRAARDRLEAADPLAPDLLKFHSRFIAKLEPLAERYEKEKRPHSAIRVHQEILSLDPERKESLEKIEEISSAPDPSLAETAKPKDLLEGTSAEWIRKHDARHATWENRAKLVKPNYVTHTDAGYEVLVRAAEAMEQMNSFYREFFRYGTPEHGGSVPRIDLNIFKNRDEYLKYGIGPPVEWSGGHFTGGAVETFIGPGGFEGMVSTLFHEAAHQFVALATTATGWLNEGLASFFEGTRILSNGTVQMNLPANHRLFPLAARMERGWMRDVTDGTDPSNPSGSTPSKAPTFRILIENEYAWGPPWYAPTWGVVYFLYNFQDPVDGRFVYRRAFQDFINSSGGRVGKGAVENFEKVVLANPARRTKGVDFSSSPDNLRLPRNVAELDELWKEFILRLRDEQTGRLEVSRPYLDWGRYAIARKEYDVAREHFEKGAVETPRDVELLTEFAELLASRFRNPDRATKLVVQALQVLESADEVDERRVAELDGLLRKWDPRREDLARIREELRAEALVLVERYREADLPMMVMDLGLRFGRQFGFPEMFDLYASAARKSGKTLSLWQLAYNEADLEGWDSAGNTVYEPYGSILRASFGEFAEGKYDFQFLTLDKVTSGDFSMEAEIRAEYGESAFCGLVFGQKSAQAFHSLVYFPGQGIDEESGADLKGFVDLTSFYGAGSYKVWRHNPVATSATGWHKLRVDVTGTLVDVWFDDLPVVTHDFGTLDVLRGRFGLITGPGKAQFRTVRYLAREARDPGAWIDRRLRMEKYSSPDASVGGSWLHRVPPFPTTSAWLREPRTSWAEKGPVPTLVVFWSPKQNELVRIDEWLQDLYGRHRDIGLEIVSISEPDDPETIRAYLSDHPFPGSVGVDALDRFEGGYGVTFEEYGIGAYFNLPRLVLLDLDGKVVWEGDPGFELNKPWQPGEESYLDTPLEELIEKRMLHRLVSWRAEWRDVSADALERGDVDRLLPLLVEARSLPDDVVPEVREAVRMLRAIEEALASLDETVEKIESRECEPAVPALVAWAERIEKPIDPTGSEVRAVRRDRNLVLWKRLLGFAERARARWEAGREETEARILLKKTETFPGRLAEEFRRGLEEAVEAGDMEAAKRWIFEAERFPDRWLLLEFFGFGRAPSSG